MYNLFLTSFSAFDKVAPTPAESGRMKTTPFEYFTKYSTNEVQKVNDHIAIAEMGIR